jgi:hypothetical protein
LARIFPSRQPLFSSPRSPSRNTAVFSLVNAVLVSPLPFPHASQLVEVTGRGSTSSAIQSPSLTISIFATAIGVSRPRCRVPVERERDRRRGERLQGMRATSNLFTALGTQLRSAGHLFPMTKAARQDGWSC